MNGASTSALAACAVFGSHIYFLTTRPSLAAGRPPLPTSTRSWSLVMHSTEVPSGYRFGVLPGGVRGGEDTRASPPVRSMDGAGPVGGPRAHRMASL